MSIHFDENGELLWVCIDIFFFSIWWTTGINDDWWMKRSALLGEGWTCCQLSTGQRNNRKPLAVQTKIYWRLKGILNSTGHGNYYSLTNGTNK
jgi:hypothetical protein